jgi:hypothetical protein
MWRLILASGVLLAALAAAVGPSAEVTFASFHCMRIHAVKAGFGGDPKVQYIELRMNTFGQNLVGGHVIEFRDGSGTLKATFTFPANVTNANTGDSILIASPEFNAISHGGGADFIFSNGNTVGANGGDPLHPIQTPDGKITFAPGFSNCAPTTPVDSVSYGTVSGAAAPDYGSAAVALPAATDNRALRLSNLGFTPTNNSTEYSLQPVATSSFAVAPANLASDFSTPRNNSRNVLELSVAVVARVGGVAEAPALAPGAVAASPGDAGHGHRGWYAVAGVAGALSLGAWGALWAFGRWRAQA